MLPSNQLSSLTQRAEFIYPDNIENSLLTDYELGGIALNDPSKGLSYQVWTCTLEGEIVRLNAPSLAQKISLFSLQGVTEISFAFDQNMTPFVAYAQGEENCGFRWFDPLTQAYTFTNLPGGSYTPRVCLDDKREIQLSSSDILLFYLRGTTLYYRQQRDRYQIEYNLKEGVQGRLLKVGMNTKNRIQLKLQVDA